MYIHLFTGTDGESHFEEMAFPFPPVEGLRAGELNAAGVFYKRFPAGHEMDAPAPRRQYVVGLQGRTRLTMRDGTSVEVGPGDVVLAEDVNSSHHTRMVGDVDRVSLVIPIQD